MPSSHCAECFRLKMDNNLFWHLGEVYVGECKANIGQASPSCVSGMPQINADASEKSISSFLFEHWMHGSSSYHLLDVHALMSLGMKFVVHSSPSCTILA